MPAEPAPTVPPASDEHNAPEVEAAYAATPEGMKAEIIDGVFHMMNRPATRHTSAASTLGMLIGPAYRLGRGGPGGWVILFEPELHLGRRPDKVGPDLAGWRRERLPVIPSGTSITLAPDWICEVLSESTEDRDRVAKMRVYRRERVAHYWLVDPVERTLEIYRLESARWQLAAEFAGDAKVRAEPFADLELDLALLWSD